MPKQLLEDFQGPFIVDRAADGRAKGMVTESRADGLVITRLPGRLSICNEVNGNNRIYPRSVWEKNLMEGSQLRQRMANCAAFGLLEHPKDGVVDLLSPIAVITTEAKLVGDEVHGELVILNTAEGRKLHALIEGGYNPLVSSRGFGSLEKNESGADVVQDDYICEGWDPVYNPSFARAELTPDRTPLSKDAAQVQTINATESIKPAAAAPAATAPKAIVETVSVKPTPDSPAAPQPQKPATMKLNQIRESLNSFRSVDASKLSPAKLAESVAAIEQLHESVDAAAAEDKNVSNWSLQKVHQDIESVKAQFEAAVSAPREQVKKLSEEKTKLLKVGKYAIEHAALLKDKLSETVKNSAKKDAVVEELVKRGRGWQAVAERRAAKLEALTKRYDISTEANDLIAARYISDTLALGKRILTLEFAAKISNPEIQKKLNEATHPKHLVSIREELEGKPAGTTPDATTPEGKKDKDGKPVAAATATPTTESQPAKPTTPVNEDVTRPAATPASLEESTVAPDGSFNFGVSSINESVDMVKRLSQARK